MEDQPPRSHPKRSLPPPEHDDDDSNKPPGKKRVRFPKGEKAKKSEDREKVNHSEDRLINPRFAAKLRAMRRNHQINPELFSIEEEDEENISAAEEHYEGNETFEEFGFPIELFNLEEEREEGYFDEYSNFVEFIDHDKIKDAWLDSVEVDPKLAEKGSMVTPNNGGDGDGDGDGDDNFRDLSAQEIGEIKRRIADALESGETIVRALRRLKGNSDNKKEKMCEETRQVFDQLTEDAMRLTENGDYDVYDEKKEVFEREAEGYERLALARGGDSGVEGPFDIFAAAADDENTNSNL